MKLASKNPLKVSLGGLDATSAEFGDFVTSIKSDYNEFAEQASYFYLLQKTTLLHSIAQKQNYLEKIIQELLVH